MSHPYIPYPTPPSPIAHKVWILDCKNCHMFLTNRGMKAVLLLRPNVSLYSSDALPVNCSPYNSSSGSCTGISSRTCECLTQSLCCHGCGSTIGYVIIVPCSRCTFSLSETNRATNGHRFVFQSSEVSGTERHYVPNEKDIIPFDIGGINTVEPHTHPIDSLTTAPAVDFTDIDYSQQQSFEHVSRYPGRRIHSSPFQPRTTRIPGHHPLISSTDARRNPPPVTNSNPYSTADQKYAPTTPPVLKAGDVIFWHHLAWSGEILEVVDDERARRPAEFVGGGMYFDR